MSTPSKDQAAAIEAAIRQGDAVICMSRCESCQIDFHYDEPTWHSWAGPEDVAHAAMTGQPNPSQSRCGCHCARGDQEGVGS